MDLPEAKGTYILIALIQTRVVVARGHWSLVTLAATLKGDFRTRSERPWA
jgi:hypothetical protein